MKTFRQLLYLFMKLAMQLFRLLQNGSYALILTLSLLVSAVSARAQTLDIEGAMRAWHDILRYSTGVTTTPVGAPSNPTTLFDPDDYPVLPLDLETQVIWPSRVDKTKTLYEPPACFYTDDLAVAPDARKLREELLVKYLAQRIYNNLNALVYRRFDPNATSDNLSDPTYYAQKDDYTLDVWTAINQLDQDDDSLYSFSLYSLMRFKHKPNAIGDAPLDSNNDASWTRLDPDKLLDPNSLFTDDFRARYKDLIRRYYLSDLILYKANELYGSTSPTVAQWDAIETMFNDTNFDATYAEIPDDFFNEFDFGGYTQFNYRIRYEALVDHWLNRDAQVVFGDGTGFRNISRTAYVSQFLGGVQCGDCTACEDGCLNAGFDFGAEIKIDLGETCLKEVGQLIIKSESLDQALSELATPAALRYWVSEGAILVWGSENLDRTGNPQLLQIAVGEEGGKVNHDPFNQTIEPLHLVDIDSDSVTNGFAVKFYAPDAVTWERDNDYAEFPITGNPYQEIRIELIGDELHVKEIRDGYEEPVNHVAYTLDTSSDITWELIENPELQTDKRITEFVYQSANGTAGAGVDYLEANTVFVDGVKGSQTVTEHTVFPDAPLYGKPTKVAVFNEYSPDPFNDPFDELVTSNVWTSGVNKQVMHYGYYEDLPADDPRFGLLKYEYDESDRFWTYNDYLGTADGAALNGFPLRVITPYKNGPAGYDPTSGSVPSNNNVRIYESTYNADNISFLSPGNTNTVVKVNREVIYDSAGDRHVTSLSFDVSREVNGEIRRSMYQADVSAYETVDFFGDSTWTETAWSNPDNLASHSTMVASGIFAGRIEKQSNPDGTVVLYEYDIVDGELTTTVKSGVPSSDTNISKGTVTTTQTDDKGRLLIRDTYDVESGITIDSMVNSNPDDQGRYQTTTYLNGTTTSRSYDCCNMAMQIGPDGTVTNYTYDDLDRMTSSETNGITIIYQYDAAGRQTYTYRAYGTVNDLNNLDPADANVRLISERSYDIAGNVLYELDELGRKTVTSRKTYYDTGKSESITEVFVNDSADAALLAESVSTYDLDGSMISSSGESEYPSFYEHGVITDESNNQRTALSWTKVFAGADNTASEWTMSYVDMMGRSVRVVKPTEDGGGTVEWTSEYNAISQLVKETDPDGVTTLYAYNDEGQLSESAVDVNRNGVIDGTDRLTRQDSGYGVDSILGDSAYSRSYVATDNGEELVSESFRALTAVSYDGQDYQSGSRVVSYDVSTLNFTQLDPVNQQRTVKTFLPDGNVLTQFTDQNLLQYESNANTGEQVNYEYDDWRRLAYQYSSRTGDGNKTQFEYDAVDRIFRVTTADPDPDVGATGEGKEAIEITYAYNDLVTDAASDFNDMRTVAVTSPNGKGGTHTVTSGYDKRGQLVLQTGGFNYPVGYEYNNQGRLSKMTTWQDYDAVNEADKGKANTFWDYNANRGFLDKKRYNNSPNTSDTGVEYDYTPSGRLKTRTWERGLTTTYDYNHAGELSIIDYQEADTIDIGYFYDRAGRLQRVEDASGTRQMYYDRGRLVSERYTTGELQGVTISRSFDQLNRLAGLDLNQSASGLSYAVDYGYDDASRLQTITNGEHVFTYDYVDNSSLIETVTTEKTGGAAPIQTNTRTYDLLNRLLSTGVITAASITKDYAYQYNNASQRTKLTVDNDQYWNYGYDDMGQVISGEKFDPTDTVNPIAGRDFQYAFDDIGNRTSADLGAPLEGARGYNDATSPTTAQTESQLLNQYYQITNPDPAALRVEGEAHTDATVTAKLDGVDATAKLTDHGDRWTFYDDNLSANDYVTLEVQGDRDFDSDGDGTPEPFTATDSESFFIPPAVVQPAYDSDGNLTYDGRWNYVWNGENRLIEMTTAANAVTAGVPKQKLEFAYDSIGRRFKKEVYVDDDGNGTDDWTTSYVSYFVYDGWNLITEYKLAGPADPQSTIKDAQYYTWGLDLSGTLQGAGGVGGLLMNSSSGNREFGVKYCFSVFDGNGNARVYLDDLGEFAVEFTFGPFSELLKSAGSMADKMSFRFATKYQDEETGLLYYGYRYYEPVTGRWLNRDPLGEFGGTNIYSAMLNNPVQFFDSDGRIVIAIPIVIGVKLTEVLGGIAVSGLLVYGAVEVATPDTDVPRPPVAPAPDVGIGLPPVPLDSEGNPIPLSTTDNEVKPERKPDPEPRPSPLRIPSTDQDKRNCKCSYAWITKKPGNKWAKIHDAFANEITGINKEVFVYTPENIGVIFDGGSPFPFPKTVYEFKTGHAWLNRNNLPYFASDRIEKMRLQFASQAVIAERCKIKYKIIFDNIVGYLGAVKRFPVFSKYMSYRKNEK
ncbi:RHS repeat-associated core domain-containing protein [Rubellicoccus peritrichatus]|uniref:RHS repeat-associated core domain-containing protein n=1 Tax=Rubellicoccus peritrichatus TaxID=3080537 RepID=A0AAQ3L8V5_9BACT|nr:RHS repeat-associated core domain-containing protein [Puniceicoccus sp. CR14]WOO40074.1 RHS repeat-associated core domain-containing protein [Puniceicoccus sp. CR14]